MSKNIFFYKYPIFREREQEYIRQLLKKYKNKPVTEELRKEVYEELSREKEKGKITIPFKIVMRRDAEKKYPDQIEVILDTKV